MIKVVGQALGEYGDQLVAEIEKKIAEEVGRLRAEVNLERASADGDVVLLPNPQSFHHVVLVVGIVFVKSRNPLIERRHHVFRFALAKFTADAVTGAIFVLL